MLTSLNSLARNMADYFEPSPRATKRRKTSTYKMARGALEQRDNLDVDLDAADERSVKGSRGDTMLEGSTYGSKEDSFLDEGGLFDGISPERDTDQTNNVQEIAETPVSDTEKRQYKEVTPPIDNVRSAGEEMDLDNPVQPRSSGRQRRRPRRFSLSPEKPKSLPQPKRTTPAISSDKKNKARLKLASSQVQESASTLQTRGILTPSRKERKTGIPKSVLFEQDEIRLENDLGFRDIQSSNQKSTCKTKSPSVVNDADIEQGLSPVPSKKGLQNAVSSALRSEQGQEDEIDTEVDDVIIQDPIEHDIEGQFWEVEHLGHLLADEDPLIVATKAEILERLNCRVLSHVPSHLETQYNSVYSLLKATVTSGESNSLLLLGARGAGKTNLLEAAIAKLANEHSNDFHTIRLNGFFQTDDKVALREIWRQLGREMQIDEMETGENGGSYADTMSSLLGLLSHPDEFADESAMDKDHHTTRISKSVVFILDEFDLFTTHPRQTLLYNLFDIAQSKKAPIAVVGCSTRMDVVDCLEKRVKSRFSHRWVHMPSVKTIEGLKEIVKNALMVEATGPIQLTLSKLESESRTRWNDYIQSVFLLSPVVDNLIKKNFYSTKSISELLAELYVPVATLELDNPSSRLANKELAASPPGLLTLLPSLPSLHLSLLIAASRLDTIHNLTTLNLNLVYAHYVELISRSKLRTVASGAVAVGAALRQWNRQTAQSVWEDLATYEYIIPASGAVTTVNRNDVMSASCDNSGSEGANTRMWRVDVSLEELSWAIKQKWKEAGGVRDVLSRWCREI